MKDNKKFSARRRAALTQSLKGAAATGALAGSYVWKKPIVEFVNLPAHAQTSLEALTITRIRVTGAISDTPDLLVENPAPGTNVGTVSGAEDTGHINIRGVISHLPAGVTGITISGTAATGIDSTNSAHCIFDTSNPCLASVPVDTADGEFIFNSGIEGLDDYDNTYTLTFSVAGLPDTIIRFNISP